MPTQSAAPTVASVGISHPERLIIHPEQGIAKLQLARYYESIS